MCGVCADLVIGSRHPTCPAKHKKFERCWPYLLDQSKRFRISDRVWTGVQVNLLLNIWTFTFEAPTGTMTRRKPLWSCLLTRQIIASQQLRKSDLGWNWYLSQASRGVVYSCNFDLGTGDSRNICIILLPYISVRRPGFTENTRGTTKLLLPSFAWMVMAKDSETYEIGFDSTASAAASSNHQNNPDARRPSLHQPGRHGSWCCNCTARHKETGHWRIWSQRTLSASKNSWRFFFNCPGFLRSIIW